GVSTSREGLVPRIEHARRFLEPAAPQHSAPASGRYLRAKRVRHRHGHQWHVAVRAAARGSGRYAVSLDVPRYAGPDRRQEVSHRDARRPGPVEPGADRTEDAAKSTEERQAVSDSVPVFGGPMVRPPGRVE